MTYAYGYNEFHKLSQIKIDGKPMPLVQYSYKNQNGALKSMRYANAHTVEYTYDRFGRPIRETWKLGTTVTQDTKYTYDGNGNPVSVLDITNQIEYAYVYENGRLICEMQSEGAYIDDSSFKHPGTLKCKTVYRYNSKGELAEKTFYDADGSITDKFVYTDDSNTTVTLPTGAKARSRSDKLGRQEFDEVQTGSGAFSRKFAYVEGAVPEEYKTEGKVISSPTTNLVERISYSDGDELTYTYDAEERITSVAGKYTSLYEYDCHGQLITETFTSSDGIDIVEVEYDAVGNITEKDGKVYEYDRTWKDQLAKYDGKNIYYDSLGNPTNYLGNILMWTAGRKLQSFCGDIDGEETYISYKYNSLGQRICKSVGDTEHEYFYEGNRLIKEVRTESDGTVHTLVFLYDASDSPIGMQYDGTAYYYKKNLQGDVIALLDATGDTIAEYIYDAWGALREPVADGSIAGINPIRYRGYYYDSETCFYFLQSRYYDPVVGRFINADEPIFLGVSDTVGSYNLFAYCENNPINYTDPLGFWLLATAGAGVAGTLGTATAVGGANAWHPGGWIILGVVAIATIAYLAYSFSKINASLRTKTLPDTKAKKQDGKPYQLAYISAYGGLVKVGQKMDFITTLGMLGVSGAMNNLSARYTYDRGSSSIAQRILQELGGNWGIYADSQTAAKALALVFGGTERPEVHSSGMYGHYHDSTHTFHIWYGGIVNY